MFFVSYSQLEQQLNIAREGGGKTCFFRFDVEKSAKSRKAEDIIVVSQPIIYFVADCCRCRYETHLGINHYIVGGYRNVFGK